MTKLPFKVGSEPRGRNIRIEMKVVSFFRPDLTLEGESEAEAESGDESGEE